MLLIIQYLQLIYITLIFFTFRTKQYRSSISSSAALKRAQILFTTGRHVSSDRLFYFSYNFFFEIARDCLQSERKVQSGAEKRERRNERGGKNARLPAGGDKERKRETPPAFYSQVSRLEFFNPRHFAMVGRASSRETLLSSLQHVRTAFETGFTVCLKYEKVTVALLRALVFFQGS